MFVESLFAQTLVSVTWVLVLWLFPPSPVGELLPAFVPSACSVGYVDCSLLTVALSICFLTLHAESSVVLLPYIWLIQLRSSTLLPLGS